MRRNNRYSKAKSNKHPILWMLTGLLIGVFVCSLTFLKKKETLVTDHPEQAPTTLASKSVLKHKTKGQEIKKNHAEAAEQYDFYTMLPKMQSNQPEAEPAATAPPPKPTKPLAVAEQSMLSPGTKPDVTAAVLPSPTSQQTASSAPTPQAPATTQTNLTAPSNNAATISPPPQPKKYTVTAGSFDSYDQADAEKATLVLAGITHAKIESYTSTGSTRYRLNLGTFANKAAATKILGQLKDAQLSGNIDEI